MVEITPLSDRIILEVKGLDKLWSLKSQLEIPLEHIKQVQADPTPAMGWFDGLKVMGTSIPHVFRAGLFWHNHNKVFWDVRHPEKTIVFDLEGDFYSQLIVEVQDPQAAIKTIRQALQTHASTKAAAVKELAEIV